MAREFSRVFASEISKVRRVYSPDLDADYRYRQGHALSDLAVRAGQTLHGWLDRGNVLWDKGVDGFGKHAPTYAELVRSCMYSFISHLDERLPSLQKKLRELEAVRPGERPKSGGPTASLDKGEWLALIDHVSRDDLERLLVDDLQKIPTGPHASMNVSVSRRKLLVQSRLLEEDVQRFLNYSEEAERESDVDKKANFNALAKTYAEHISAQNPALILFNSALARAKLENAGNLSGEERKRIARAVFSFYGPSLRQGGLYSEGSDLENFAFQQCHDPEYRVIRDWLEKNKGQIEQKTKPEQLKHLATHLQAEYEKRFGETISLQVDFRIKSPYSIWRKNQQTDPKTGKSRFTKLDDIHDVLALRILVDEPDGHRAQNACYKLLGLIPQAMQSGPVFPVSDVVDVHDYLGQGAKPNGYQSLHGHLNVYRRSYLPTRKKFSKVEMQILPLEQHHFNEDPDGAAHWQHKAARDHTPRLLSIGLPAVLGTAPRKEETYAVHVTTEGVGGNPQTVYLHPYHKVIDALAMSHPQLLGRFKLETFLHPQSPKPRNWLGFGKSNVGHNDSIVNGLHLIVRPTNEPLPPGTAKHWLTDQTLSDTAKRVLREAAKED